MFPKIMVSPNHPNFNRFFHYKPSIWGGFPPIFGSTPIRKLRNGRTLQFDLGQKAQFETPFKERDFWLFVKFFCFFCEVFFCVNTLEA